MTPEKQNETGESPDEQAPAETGAGAPKQRRSHATRSNANLRSAKRANRGEDVDPEEQLRLLLAEAQVLALLDLADAVRGSTGEVG